jgi:hypothetical protein
MKLPLAGFRDAVNATIFHQGSYGFYWSSSPHENAIYSDNLFLNSSFVVISYGDYDGRALGVPVRCFKNP